MTRTGTIGTLGHPWRADVTAWGAVVPWDGSTPLDWRVAADDRWHTPADEVAVRQVRLAGAPVFETRLRIPGGDAVHRVWATADHGGLTVVELTNDSPLPIACAVTRTDLLTGRPPSDVPIRGIDLPVASVLLPIGHRSTVQVALQHVDPVTGALPPGLPSAASVVRGWTVLTERASRLVLPDVGTVEAVTAARCDLVLRGPVTADDDPVGFLLGAAELVRLGELGRVAAAAYSPAIAEAVETIATRTGWDVDAALAAAAVVLGAAGEGRAGADLREITTRRSPAPPPPATRPDGIAAIAAVERTIARGGELFPHGFPPSWRGAELEAHGLVAGPTSRLSLAVRWHGPNPAVLWEVDGDPVELTAPAVDPAWRTNAPQGETLWRLAAAPCG